MLGLLALAGLLPLGAAEREARAETRPAGVAELVRLASKELRITEKWIGHVFPAGAKVAARVVGAVVAIEGGLRICDGLQQIGEGQMGPGSLETAIGLGDAVTGCLMLSGEVSGGSVTGGVTAILDGGKDVALGLQRGDTERTVVGTVKIAAGSVVAYGVYTGQPAAVIVGGATYTGVVLYEQREVIAEGARVARDWAKDRAELIWEETGRACQFTGRVLSMAKDAAWDLGVLTVDQTGAALTRARDASWNAGVYAVDRSGTAMAGAKNAAWNVGVDAVQKLAVERDALWNRIFR